MNISIGLGILLTGIIIAIAILYVNRKQDWNFKKIFLVLGIILGVSFVLLMAASWFLNHTKIHVQVNADLPSPINILPFPNLRP